MQKIKELMLYAGVKKERYNELRTAIFVANASNLRIYTLILMILFLVMAIVSWLGDGFTKVNSYLYLIVGAIMLLIFSLLNMMKVKKNNNIWLTSILMYIFLGTLYTEAILVTLNHLDMPAVTFIGILLALPLLFADRPMTMFLFQSIYVVVFCLFSKANKLPSVSEVDIWNGLTFLVLSFIAMIIVMPMRIKNMSQTEEIDRLSRFDVLTGVQNRNAFEQFCHDAAREKEEKPFCIFADVNGLHELNNAEGHAAGDQMLQFAAKKLREFYGEANVYRIGGDEFLVFVPVGNDEVISTEIAAIEAELEDEDYSISLGVSGPDDHTSNMEELVALAEQRMKKAKDLYYEKNGLEKRNL